MTAKQKKVQQPQSEKITVALNLIKRIKNKLIGLKHGYITETELNELEELVKKIR